MIESHLRFVNNFVLHESLHCMAGIDLAHYFPEELTGRKDNTKVLREHWSQCDMGFKPSPYFAI
jgi:hypothetical protein